MKLGEKIKQIRKDNDWSQEYICTQSRINQSTLSGIENDKWNPPETTVRDLADALERSFDTLIEGTDWKSDDKKNVSGSYAISPSEVKVTIDDNGSWHYHNLSYPIKDSDGGDNKFSPTTGQALIYECEDCKRPINKPENKYCMGCGKNLIPDFRVFDNTKEWMATFPYMTDPRAAETCLKQLTSDSSYYNDLIGRLKTFRDVQNLTMDKKELETMEKAWKSMGIYDEIEYEKLPKNIFKLFDELQKLKIPIDDFKLSEDQIDVKEMIIILEFNISIVEGLAKNMYVFVQKNTSKSFEVIRLELYGRLADTIDDVSLSLAVDLEKNEGINEQALAARVKVKTEALNQLKEMLQTLEGVKDESYEEINNLINKASTLTDEKISNDLDEEKSRSNEKEDSSSIEDEKSSKPNKKGA